MYKELRLSLSFMFYFLGILGKVCLCEDTQTRTKSPLWWEPADVLLLVSLIFLKEEMSKE